jgi:hypothetical protein
MSRADALKRLNGLAAKVEDHLAKLAQSPASRDVPHWRREINNWIRQMEEVLPMRARKRRPTGRHASPGGGADRAMKHANAAQA